MSTPTMATDTISVPLTQEILDQCLNCPSNGAIVVPLSSVWNDGHSPINVAYSLADVVADRSELSTTIVIDSSPAAAATELSRTEGVAMTFASGHPAAVNSGEHRTLIVSRQTRPKALSTAPTVVELRRCGRRWCAFARRCLPAQSRFGPLDAPIGGDPSLYQSPFILVVPIDGRMQYLNLEDDSTADWMKFVRPTREKRKQNLEVVYGEGEGLFFDATRVIETDEELRVWYSNEYEEMLRTAGVLNEQSNSLVCFDCDVHFDSHPAFEQHLQLEHDGAPTDDCYEDDKNDPTFSLRDRSLNKNCHGYSQSLQAKRFRLNMARVPVGKQILRRYLKQLKLRGQRRYTFERRYYCKRCRVKLYTAKESKNHALKHELFGEAAHMCQFCGRRFFLVQTLKAHSMSTHFMDRIFFCDICNSSFSKETLLHIHLRSHTTDQWSDSTGHGDYACPAIGCYDRFPTDADLVAHVSNIHTLPSATSRRSMPDPSLACRCELCGRTFLTSSARTAHMSTHQTAAPREFKCPLCDTVFHSPKLVPEHVANTHKLDGRFNCSLCDRTFDSWEGARRHGRYYHTKSQYDCTICGRQFLRSDKLRNHMTTHSDDRPWLCDMCGARYKRKDKLTHHMKTHANDAHSRVYKPASRAQLDHEQYLVSEFRCELCLVGFKKRGMLVNHVASKHRSDDAREVAPCLLKSIARPKMTFGCSLCPKTYSARRKLKSHVEKHHGRAFEDAQSTLLFDGNMTEVKPYRCGHCPKEYLHKSHLLAHERKYHPQLADADKDAPSTSDGQMPDSLKRSLSRLKPIAPSIPQRKKKQNPPMTMSDSDRPAAKVTSDDDLLSRAMSMADVDLSLLMTPPHNPSSFLVRTPNQAGSQ
uniref:Uncharacterized protein n=1 Tax=Plectus sambesii TaxID=2011161 RepID=A0A914US61_9BILA